MRKLSTKTKFKRSKKQKRRKSVDIGIATVPRCSKVKERPRLTEMFREDGHLFFERCKIDTEVNAMFEDFTLWKIDNEESTPECDPVSLSPTRRAAHEDVRNPTNELAKLVAQCWRIIEMQVTSSTRPISCFTQHPNMQHCIDNAYLPSLQ